MSIVFVQVKMAERFSSSGRRFSFDGEICRVELTDEGFLPPECARYQYKTRTATTDQSTVSGYCGIRDFDAYVSPTKYKAYRNDLPNRHGAPYDYRVYMKNRTEYFNDYPEE